MFTKSRGIILRLTEARCVIQSFTFYKDQHSSIKSTFLQVVFNDDICNSIKNKLHILGVCGTGEVGVDLLGIFSSIQIFKLALDVSSCFFVCIGTLKTFNIFYLNYNSHWGRKDSMKERHLPRMQKGPKTNIQKKL